MVSPSIPSSMMAIEIRGHGGPEMLVPGERPVPVPGDGEVLVRIAAAGVNRPDVHQRQGNYPPPPGVTDIPGLEVAGEVAATGPGATIFAIGDKVVALVAGGGYAEYATVHETNALPVPNGLSMIEAAAIPETYFTVWSNVFDRGGLKPGETLLVHGGGSGIGTAAIQLGKAFGATVIVTAANDVKCEACRKLGANLAINHRSEDFVAVVKIFTEGRGADVILDMVGGDYVARNYAAAAEDGRIVQIAFIGGATANVDFRPIMVKRLTHTGSTLRARPVAFKAKIAEAVQKNVWPLLEAGKARPIIDTTFPLRNAADAHARIESWEHFGKIVLTV